jgi:hypothetical protein
MSVWAFNLRSYGCRDPDDTDSESDDGEETRDSARLHDGLDISSRYDTADYKPNPWTIAKINAASRSQGNLQRTGTDDVDSEQKLKTAPPLSNKSNIEGRKFPRELLDADKPLVYLKDVQTSSAIDQIASSSTTPELRLASKSAQPTRKHPASINFPDLETSDGLKLDSAPKSTHTASAFPPSWSSSSFHGFPDALPRIADAPHNVDALSHIANLLPHTAAVLPHTADVPLPTSSAGFAAYNSTKVFPTSFSSPVTTVRTNVCHYSSPIPPRRSHVLSNSRHRSKPVQVTRPAINHFRAPFDEEEDPDASWSTLPSRKPKANYPKTTVMHSGKFRLPVTTPLCRRPDNQEGEPVGRRSIILYRPPPMRNGSQPSMVTNSNIAASSSPRQSEPLSASSGLSSSPGSLVSSTYNRMSDQPCHSLPEANASTTKDDCCESEDIFRVSIDVPSVLSRYPQTKLLLSGVRPFPSSSKVVTEGKL